MISIRKLGYTDAARFRALRLQALQTDGDAFVATMEEEQAMSIEQLENKLKADLVLGAFIGNRLIGTLVFMEQEKQKFKHIGILGGMYVDPEYRGLGVGKELVAEMLSYLRKFDHLYSLQLKVITTNTAAIRLYEAFGFWRWASEEKALQYKGKFFDQFHMMLRLKPE